MSPFVLMLTLTGVMSLVSFLMMGIDKRLAQKGLRRISEKNLLLGALLFGGLGGTAGMFFFHHKTKHLRFRILLPLFTILQLALLAFTFLSQK